MNEDKKNAGIILLIIGIVVSLFGSLIGYVVCSAGAIAKIESDQAEERFSSFQEDSIKVSGKIISSYDGETIVKYEDEDGEEYEAYFSCSSSSFKSGNSVEVYYDEKEPEIAVVPEIEITFNQSVYKVVNIVGMVIIIVCASIGLLVTIIGIVLTLKYKKEKSLYSKVNNSSCEGCYNDYKDDFYNGMM